MALDVGLLTGLAAKLVSLGIDGWEAEEKPGWGIEDAKAFEAVLDGIGAFSKLFRAKPESRDPIRSYCELVTVAFGEAWRRHWVYDERLAPAPSAGRFRGWFRGRSASARLLQVRTALLDGNFAQTLGDASQDADVVLIGRLAEPLRSPWYASLWAAFSREPSEPSDLPPLLL